MFRFSRDAGTSAMDSVHLQVGRLLQ